jgi:hypothetical protein
MKALRVPATILAALLMGKVSLLSWQQADEKALTNETIIELVKVGISEKNILELIGGLPGKYSATPGAVLEMRKAGVPDSVIAAVVSKSVDSANDTPREARSPTTADLPDDQTRATPQKLTVRTVSHSRREFDFTLKTPQTTDTDCALYPGSLNCHSTSYGGESQTRAVYRFTEIVTSTVGGSVTRYTLSRTVRWAWNSLDWLNDGELFPAEIRGKHMFVTYRRGGNQGKKHVLRYDILDIRTVP